MTPYPPPQPRPGGGRGRFTLAAMVAAIVLLLVVLGSLVYAGVRLLGWGSHGTTQPSPDAATVVVTTTREQPAPGSHAPAPASTAPTTRTTVDGAAPPPTTRADQAAQTPSSPTTTTTTAAGRPSGFTPPEGEGVESCGADVWAETTATSCPFARQVAAVLGTPPPAQGRVSITATSPVTNNDYQLDCVRIDQTTGWRCRGGDNAVVVVNPGR
ncbi:hypothetical protein ACFSSC_06155 [Corynebacterium mendelii]|uniref:Uncharacterized protein n=1 Tax=Corynebacterium mendelii TaxID=2765362 RepID=A0A939E2Y3_9CORY|nr:hypothetical protein [Corynebacterium mendelii]MBN9644562.1 hypothetical protein [Corynebacterium mendelii]